MTILGGAILGGSVTAFTIPAGETRYISLFSDTGPFTSELDACDYTARPGNARNLYIKVGLPGESQPGDGNLVATIRKEFTDTPIVATLDAGSSGAFQDTEHSQDFSTGERICLRLVNNSLTAASISLTHRYLGYD